MRNFILWYHYSYQANNATIKAAAKRYRYTGMERDEETGPEYHLGVVLFTMAGAMVQLRPDWDWGWGKRV